MIMSVRCICGVEGKISSQSRSDASTSTLTHPSMLLHKDHGGGEDGSTSLLGI